MKINCDEVILDVDEQPATQDDKPLTVGRVIVNALLIMTAKDQNTNGDEKKRRWDLADLCKSGEQELKVDDVAYIKKRIGEVCTTLIVGRMWTILDP